LNVPQTITSSISADDDFDDNCLAYLPALGELHSTVDSDSFWDEDNAAGYAYDALLRPFCDVEFDDTLEIVDGVCVDWYCYLDDDHDGSYDSPAPCLPVRPCDETLVASLFTTHSLGHECRSVEECDSTNVAFASALYYITHTDGEDCIRSEEEICNEESNDGDGILDSVTTGTCDDVVVEACDTDADDSGTMTTRMDGAFCNPIETEEANLCDVISDDELLGYTSNTASNS